MKFGFTSELHNNNSLEIPRICFIFTGAMFVVRQPAEDVALDGQFLRVEDGVYDVSTTDQYDLINILSKYSFKRPRIHSLYMTVVYRHA